MATDASNDLTYFLLIAREYLPDLAAIRQWENLKVAFDEEMAWVKDFDGMQIDSVEVKSLPSKKLYTAMQRKLFPLNSNLPERNIPGSLLWTPIGRALNVKLPALNHHFFGIGEQLNIRLVPSENETTACALIISLEQLSAYLETAPAIRLESVHWVIIDRNRVLLYGKQLLPLNGETYWQRGQNLLPAGFDLDWYSLADEISSSLNPENDALVAWNPDSSCFLIRKNELQQLSIASFRLTLKDL